MNHPRAIFTHGRRTPFGRAFKGAYHDIRADDLLVMLLRNQVAAHGEWVAHGVDDVLVGCAYPEGEQGFNVARMSTLGAGLEAPAATVNRLCASSLEVVSMGAAQIRSGWSRAIMVAGVESMSRVPRRGANFSESETIRSVAPLAYINMGETAEAVARRYPHIGRSQQEDLAEASHRQAFEAYQRGDYRPQVVPYLVEQDEFIRYPVDREKMASLTSPFGDGGVVTAATSSPLSDGATSGWLIDSDLATQWGIHDGLEVLDSAVAHVAPEVMGMGPVPAMKKLFARNNLQPTDIAAYEINEAFAIQVLACAEALSLPLDRINAWGGAMALGHPLGASGLRLVMTLHDRLRQRGEPGSLGIASLCVGGGQGMAMLFRYLGEG